MDKKNQQILSLQILRGVAAWLVVYHHYSQLFFSWDMSKSIFGRNIGYFLMHYGKLGVDIFFVISGFIIFLSAQRMLNAKKFIINRLLRVIPPYWFYTLVMVILSFFIPDAITSGWTVSSLIKSLLFIHHENPSPSLGAYPYLTVGWTLLFEVSFYIICMSSMLIFRKYWFIPVVVLLLFSRQLWPFDAYSFFFESQYIREFGWGIIIGLGYTKGLFKTNNLISLLLLSFSCGFFIYGGAQLYKITAIVLLVVALLMCNGKLFESYIFLPFKKLGDYSYSTYLIHAAISIPICSYIFSTKDYYNNDLLLFSTYTVLTLLLSYLSYRYIEGSLVSQCKKISRVLSILKENKRDIRS
ncbi:acyltransferase [Vibrio splendidus]|uniref:acyltransferase family protein n=1 Tax=Vibrio TaxID=662 RepID=UPI001603518A|nr:MULTISPECIES: acyltransferase [Vibrio]MDH5979470.1 acyltransferase [Vibrio splendidus]